MESSIQTSPETARTSGRTGLMRAMLALGAVILLGFLVYSAFLMLTRPPSFNGARVNGLNVGSPAWEAGIIPDDVITHVNGTELNSLTHLGQIITDSLGQKMIWIVERRGTTMTIEILPDTDNASDQRTVGVYLSDRYKGRKDLVLDVLPVAYIGTGFLALGLIIGLRLKRTKRRAAAAV